MQRTKSHHKFNEFQVGFKHVFLSKMLHNQIKIHALHFNNAHEARRQLPSIFSNIAYHLRDRPTNYLSHSIHANQIYKEEKKMCVKLLINDFSIVNANRQKKTR